MNEFNESFGAATAGRPANLIIVDDNQDAADMLCVSLQMAGHQVWVARSGVIAVTHPALAVADAVLIDLGMPIMNGFELARAIRRKCQDDCLLIAVTGWERPGDIEAARVAGFDHYLTKPVDPDALEAWIGKFLRTHPRARPVAPSMTTDGEAE